MIRTEAPSAPGLTILGVVRGLLAESAQVPGALEELAPETVAIGLSEEECAGLTEHFVATPTEPFVPLLASETVEVREVGRFGDVRVPHPSFVAAMEWATERGVPVEAVDPSDERYAEMFGERVGYLELVRRTLSERRLLRSPPKAASADELVLRWDAAINKGRSSQVLQSERDEHLALELRRLGRKHRKVVALIDRERVPGVLRALAPAPSGR